MTSQSGTQEVVRAEIEPTSKLAKMILKATGVNPMDCYQCGKCSSGCPLTEVTDLLPHDLWRMIQLGMEDQIKQAEHLWLCVGCETCTTRCPNKLPLPAVIDFLRQEMLEKGEVTPAPEITAFHKAFMDTVEKHGRMKEVEMIRKYKMATGDYFKDFKLGLTLFAKGKIKLFASGVANKDEIKKLFKGGK